MWEPPFNLESHAEEIVSYGLQLVRSVDTLLWLIAGLALGTMVVTWMIQEVRRVRS